MDSVLEPSDRGAGVATPLPRLVRRVAAAAPLDGITLRRELAASEGRPIGERTPLPGSLGLHLRGGRGDRRPGVPQGFFGAAWMIARRSSLATMADPFRSTSSDDPYTNASSPVASGDAAIARRGKAAAASSPSPAARLAAAARRTARVAAASGDPANSLQREAKHRPGGVERSRSTPRSDARSDRASASRRGHRGRATVAVADVQPHRAATRLRAGTASLLSRITAPLARTPSRAGDHNVAHDGGIRQSTSGVRPMPGRMPGVASSGAVAAVVGRAMSERSASSDRSSASAAVPIGRSVVLRVAGPGSSGPAPGGGTISERTASMGRSGRSGAPRVHAVGRTEQSTGRGPGRARTRAVRSWTSPLASASVRPIVARRDAPIGAPATTSTSGAGSVSRADAAIAAPGAPEQPPADLRAGHIGVVGDVGRVLQMDRTGPGRLAPIEADALRSPFQVASSSAARRTWSAVVGRAASRMMRTEQRSIGANATVAAASRAAAAVPSGPSASSARRVADPRPQHAVHADAARGRTGAGRVASDATVGATFDRARSHSGADDRFGGRHGDPLGVLDRSHRAGGTARTAGINGSTGTAAIGAGRVHLGAIVRRARSGPVDRSVDPSEYSSVAGAHPGAHSLADESATDLGIGGVAGRLSSDAPTALGRVMARAVRAAPTDRRRPIGGRPTRRAPVGSGEVQRRGPTALVVGRIAARSASTVEPMPGRSQLAHRVGAGHGVDLRRSVDRLASATRPTSARGRSGAVEPVPGRSPVAHRVGAGHGVDRRRSVDRLASATRPTSARGRSGAVEPARPMSRRRVVRSAGLVAARRRDPVRRSGTGRRGGSRSADVEAATADDATWRRRHDQTATAAIGAAAPRPDGLFRVVELRRRSVSAAGPDTGGRDIGSTPLPRALDRRPADGVARPSPTIEPRLDGRRRAAGTDDPTGASPRSSPSSRFAPAGALAAPAASATSSSIPAAPPDRSDATVRPAVVDRRAEREQPDSSPTAVPDQTPARPGKGRPITAGRRRATPPRRSASSSAGDVRATPVGPTSTDSRRSGSGRSIAVRRRPMVVQRLASSVADQRSTDRPEDAPTGDRGLSMADIDHIVRELELRVLAEIDRRGGRYAGAF